MTIERIREMTDSVILSLIHSASGKEFDNMAAVLKERGYKCKGFYWEKEK